MAGEQAKEWWEEEGDGGDTYEDSSNPFEMEGIEDDGEDEDESFNPFLEEAGEEEEEGEGGDFFKSGSAVGDDYDEDDEDDGVLNPLMFRRRVKKYG